MGLVILFPDGRRLRRDGLVREEGDTATIIILPVVRIERAVAGPTSETPKTSSGRRRRRPASRS